MVKVMDLADQLMVHNGKTDAIALADFTGAVSYATLERSVDQMAGVLQQIGIGPGHRVAIHAEKCASTVAAILAVLRTGACYVAVSPESPEKRRAFLLHDSRSEALLTPMLGPCVDEVWRYQIAFPNSIEPTGQHSTSTDTTYRFVDRTAERDVSDPAYVLYTSGSTGRPKGVVMSHEGTVAFSVWAAETVGLGPGDTVLNVTVFDFDLSIFDVFSTFYAGARLVVAGNAVPRSPKLLLETLARESVTVLYTVPWTLIQLLAHPDAVPKACTTLRTIIFAGEVFPVERLRQLMALLPWVQFYNFYGPTETNVCCAHALRQQGVSDMAEVPIGRSASEATLSILDEYRRPVPDGEIGELYVDGPTVMIGYLRDGLVQPAERPYATGDMVWRGADGEIIYRGRGDTQTKIRGHRVSLFEVEQVLETHPGIQECAACVVQGTLFAFVHSKAGLSVLAIRQHVAESLPPYMVPTKIHFTEALPRYDNGKIDRQVLERFASGMI